MSRYQRFGVSRQRKSPVDKFLSAHYRCSVRPTRQWIIHACIMPQLVTIVEHGIQKSGLARLASVCGEHNMPSGHNRSNRSQSQSHAYSLYVIACLRHLVAEESMTS